VYDWEGIWALMIYQPWVTLTADQVKASDCGRTFRAIVSLTGFGFEAPVALGLAGAGKTAFSGMSGGGSS